MKCDIVSRSVDLSYTYNSVNQFTAISDAADANYNCSVTCDADGNITQAVETYVSPAIPPVIESTLTTDFSYDWANRLTRHITMRSSSVKYGRSAPATSGLSGATAA